jgi:transposase
MADETRRGRKLGKYDAQTLLRLCTALGLGATFRLACRFAGISESTFYQWRNQTPGPLRYPRQMAPELVDLRNKTQGMEFEEIIQFYRAEACVKWLAKIEKAATDGNWTAAAWKLERLFPEDYGRSVRDIRISGSDGGPVQSEVKTEKPDLSVLDADELETLLYLYDKIFHVEAEEGGREGETGRGSLSLVARRAG